MMHHRFKRGAPLRYYKIGQHRFKTGQITKWCILYNTLLLLVESLLDLSSSIKISSVNLKVSEYIIDFSFYMNHVVILNP